MDPNRTSDKIKLTPPVDSYTITLLVLTSVLLKLLEAGFNRRIFWVVWSARMAVSGLVKDLAWQESVVLLVDNLKMLARSFFLPVDFAAYQSLTSQHSPVISCLDSNRGLPPFFKSAMISVTKRTGEISSECRTCPSPDSAPCITLLTVLVIAESGVSIYPHLPLVGSFHRAGFSLLFFVLYVLFSGQFCTELSSSNKSRSPRLSTLRLGRVLKELVLVIQW